MKKISLILALMLVLTCGVFTACGGDDTSSKPATSTASKADDSSVASEAESDAESEAESNVDASTDDSSEPEDTTPAPEATGEVISKGAAYTTQELFRQNNETYSWDENCDHAYPDTNGVEMTDGIFASEEAHNLWSGEIASPWIGFHTQTPDYAPLGYAWITVDLGEAKDITGAKIYSASTAVDNAIIETVTVMVSNDGENWEEFGAAVVDNTAAGNMITTSVGGTANAQYVQYRFTSSVYWMAICEVEVLGGAAVEDTSDVVSDASVAE